MQQDIDNQIVIFRLDVEEYGIFITEINEIIAMIEITPIAKTEKAILGIINLRGEIIPLYDLRIQLDKEPSSFHKKKRIIITTINGTKIGLLVDEVTKVLKIEKDNIEEVQHSFSNKGTGYIHSFYKTDENVITLLKTQNILNNYK